jgi:RHS repeat-associated protein
MDYDEFGNVLQDTNTGFQPFGFQGGLYDRDTGLVRFGARDYDPRIGRWLTKDALGFEAGINFYVFCGNDPVNRTDPYGLAWYDNWHYESRDSRNSNLPSSPEQARRAGGTLLSPEMSRYHDDPSTKGSEKKFIFQDGREAVYNVDTGQLVTDSRYKGTYNYVNPAPSSWNPLNWQDMAYRGLGHFLADMLPYYIWGNDRPSNDKPCK